MGQAVKSIAGVAAPFINLTNQTSPLGNTIGWMNKNTGGWADAFGQGGALMGPLNEAAGIGNAPEAPKTPSSLDQLKNQQQQYAQQFSQNLPQLQKQTAGLLTQQSNKQMNAQLQQTKNNNNARGLLYGGVNQGAQQQVRSTAQQNLSQAISNSNAGLENAANTLNSQAIETGVGIQKTQQEIQNSIFQQQMAQMQAQNSGMGGLLGLIGTAAAVMA